MLTLENKILVLLYITRRNWETGLEAVYQPEQFIYNSFARKYKKSSLRQRLWELSCRGEITKALHDGRKCLELTKKGREIAIRQAPALRDRRGWDGVWRLLAVDFGRISSRAGAVLRRRLALSGFGRYPRGLWLSPLAEAAKEIGKFLEEGGLSLPVVCWEARRVFGEENRSAAGKAWSLDKLNQSYAELVKEWSEGQKSYGQNLELIKKIAAALQERYITLLCDDPGLPEELLPLGWSGKAAGELVSEWAKVIY